MTTALFNAPNLLSVALILFGLCALAGGLLTAWPVFARKLSGLGMVLAAALAVTAALMMISLTAPVGLYLPWLHLQVELSALNGVLLLAIALPALFSGLYIAGSYHAGSAGVLKKINARSAGLLNLMLAAITASILAADALWLVLFLEVAALCAYFLTALHGDSKSRRAALNQFLFSHLGTLCLILAFSLLCHTTGSSTLAAARSITLTPLLQSAVFLLALTGFGIYAGVIPLHSWVPQAHSSASPEAAALFSGALMKVGLLGIIRVGLDLLGAPPLWWGVVVLVLALITAFIGGLYALMEHDLRRLLAYHTLENIGIILLGIGGAMVGVALNQPAFAALALLAGLFHLLNHSLFKTALFLGAGAIEQQTGIKDIEKLGGLARRMPWIAAAMLIALMSMAALPPLNGFASEWLLYQSLFQMSAGHDIAGRLLGPLLAVGLALTGALALMCIAKVFGVTFLGAPRSDAAASGLPPSFTMTLSIAMLALLCLAVGVAAPWVIPLLAGVASSILQAPPMQVASQGVLLTRTAAVSPPMIAILLLSLPLLPLLLASLLRGARLPARQRGDAWACGYGHSPDMVVTATGFAQPLRVMFAPVYRLRRIATPDRLVSTLHRGGISALCHRLAFIELAVLLVITLA
ncbi:proton-conducting transporter membrane subunit [Ewingella americana]|uniref:Proton-conducting membrane transporter n=1 Tax=Ewingella americana TaxID=41202 RepID=A0A502GSZ4_9GAMM|nr:proton-conducting transporter membrane subunit [Ewingella americana]TPG64994.1 proton-conducting membrane transporter [Ewingella americana]